MDDATLARVFDRCASRPDFWAAVLAPIGVESAARSLGLSPRDVRRLGLVLLPRPQFSAADLAETARLFGCGVGPLDAVLPCPRRGLVSATLTPPERRAGKESTVTAIADETEADAADEPAPAKGATKVYAYGAKPPHANAQAVADQIHAAHRYYNVLVEIERGRRVARDETLARLWPAVASTESAWREADAATVAHLSAVAARNAEARRKTGTPEDRAETARLRDDRKAAYAAHKAAKADAYADPAAKAELARVDAEAVARGKAGRAACGCYWGSYLSVEQAADAARKAPAPPRFRRWDGCGKVSVQLQGGLAVADLLAGTDTRLRLEPADPAECPATAGGRKPKYEAWLRVGSNPDRSPVWARARVVLHRPLPGGGVVKWASLYRRRTAGNDKWTLQLTVEAGGRVTDHAAGGAAAVNLGWRVVPGGLRVAYWVGDDGAAGELVLPDADLSRWARSDTLRSTRDGNFNAARDALADWLDGFAGAVPREWRAKADRLRQWRSQGRLAVLVLYWREHRFSGDAAAYDAAEAWRKQDRHLWAWESNGRAKAIRWRADLYRNFAATLRRRYARIVLGQTDWRPLARKAGADEGPENATARYNARVASPGLLGQTLRQSGAVPAPAAWQTRRCHACGELSGEPHPERLRHACAACGAVWDQDENHCRNLLAASGGVTPAAAGPLAGVGGSGVAAGRKPSRGARLLAAKAAARKSGGNPIVGAGV